jgi:hypothetical protein
MLTEPDPADLLEVTANNSQNRPADGLGRAKFDANLHPCGIGTVFAVPFFSFLFSARMGALFIGLAALGRAE